MDSCLQEGKIPRKGRIYFLIPKFLIIVECN
nr:MAG TPA: hypothetical protein [Crassvirales sp.]DAU35314.1 MAG TPA: hypothetical protein [Caudoviricetes sp.]